MNDNGQLGDGTTTQRTTPVAVSSVTSGAAALALSYAHSCAWITGGRLKYWVSNSNGQLNDDTVTY